jgi:hypothetical protein
VREGTGGGSVWQYNVATVEMRSSLPPSLGHSLGNGPGHSPYTSSRQRGIPDASTGQHPLELELEPKLLELVAHGVLPISP